MREWRGFAAVVLGLLGACGSSEPRSTSARPDVQGWSEAGRRAAARHTWHCVNQGVSSPARSTARIGARAKPRKYDTSCDRTRFLCQQIHRGAQATDEEKAECAGYEAVHGRVSDR